MTLIVILLLALVPTIFIELGVLLLLREKRKKVLWSSVIINVFTNVPLNLYVTFVDESFTTILLAELLIILVEAAWYWLFVRRLSQAFIYSALCNAISFLTGLLFVLLFYMILLLI
ncbi:MAG: hypothetical protein IKQ59_01395 [Prevotella sp.]|nr:hypothetical protein [Prevotella sp.]